MTSSPTPEDEELLGDTWIWNGERWVERLVSGPSARAMHTMTFDSARQKVVLFGGRISLSNAATDEWDGAGWSQIDAATSSPPPTGAMVYDSARARTVVYGSLPLNETWEARFEPRSACVDCAAGTRDAASNANDACVEACPHVAGSADASGGPPAAEAASDASTNRGMSHDAHVDASSEPDARAADSDAALVDAESPADAGHSAPKPGCDCQVLAPGPPNRAYLTAFVLSVAVLQARRRLARRA